MGMAYIQFFADKEALLEPFNDEERGRLLTALLSYGLHDVEMELKGNERYIWPVFKQMVNQSRKALESKVDNGNKGGRPRKQKPTETENNLSETENNLSETENKRSEPNKTINQESRIKNQDIRINTQESSSSSPISPSQGNDGGGNADDDHDHREDSVSVEGLNTCLDAWKASGGTLNTMDRDAIKGLVSEYGATDVLDAIKAGHENGAGGKLAYLRKVLKNWREHGKNKRVESARDRPNPYSGRAVERDIMQRYTPEQRREIWNAAVVNFDDDED